MADEDPSRTLFRRWRESIPGRPSQEGREPDEGSHGSEGPIGAAEGPSRSAGPLPTAAEWTTGGIPLFGVDDPAAEARDGGGTSGLAAGGTAGPEEVFEAIASSAAGRIESPHLSPMRSPATDRRGSPLPTFPRLGTPATAVVSGTFSPRRRRRLRGRRGSVGSNASGSYAGSVSGVSYHPRPESPFITDDMYLGNPNFPKWDETDDGVEYDPWPVESDARVADLLTEVTNPPRNGMLLRVDPHRVLQEYMAESNSEPQALWESLLRAYDFAMSGKRAALLALGAAHKMIRQENERARRSNDDTERLYHENVDLHREVGRLEKETVVQQKRVSVLEAEKRTLAREGTLLKAKHEQVIAAQETQLEVLENLVRGWGTLSSTAAPGASATARHIDGSTSEDRFDSIREALEDARVDAHRSRQRCDQLQEKYEALRKKLEENIVEQVSQRFKAQKETDSKLAAEVMQLATQNEALESELEVERARAAEQEKIQGELLTCLRNEGRVTSEDYREEIDRLKRDLALYKDKCGVLQQTTDDLRRTLASQAVKSAQEYESEMQELEDHVNDPTARMSRVIERVEGTAGTSADLGAEEVLRDIKEFQVLDMQASKDAVNNIKALIKDVMEKIAVDMQDDHAIQLQEKEKILEEMRKLAVENDAMVQGHEVMVEIQELINDELTTLWQQIHDNERVRQQRARIKSAGDASHRTGKLPERVLEPSGAVPLATSEHEINCLLSARYRIEQLKENAGKVGAQEAARQCLEQLGLLLQKLRSVDPDTPTEDVIRVLMQFLEESLAKGIDRETAPEFYAKLNEHDARAKVLLEPSKPTMAQSEAEMNLLRDTRQKLDGAEELQKAQEQLMQEYADHAAQHPPGELTPKQSADLLRLASNAVEASGSSWTWPGATGRGAAGMDRVVDQIQNMVADPCLTERRRQLEDSLENQAARLSELDAVTPWAIKLADDAQRQLEAHAWLQARRQGPTTATEDETNQAFGADLKRRESRLRQEQHLNLAYLDRLQAGRMRTAVFVEREKASDRHRAEALLTNALVKLQATRAPSHHGEALCFCTLLRFLAPRIYYSTITGGCCAGGRMFSASTSLQGTKPAAACHGHHGHGMLSSSGGVWSAICRILTAFAWLVLLVLIQPYNLYSAAAFLFALLVGLPRYAFRLTQSAYSRVRHRRSAGRGSPTAHTSDVTENGDGAGEGTDAPPPAAQQPPANAQTLLQSIQHTLHHATTFTLHDLLTTLKSAPHDPLAIFAALKQHITALPSSIPTATPVPSPSVLLSAALTLLLLYVLLAYAALLVERRLWLGASDWRAAYVAEWLSTGQPLPYPGWSPLRVDYRLLGDSVWGWVAEGAHALVYGRIDTGVSGGGGGGGGGGVGDRGGVWGRRSRAGLLGWGGKR